MSQHRQFSSPSTNGNSKVTTSSSSRPPVDRSVSQEDIARRAYEIFSKRAPDEGSAEQDWYAAEQELRGAHRQ